MIIRSSFTNVTCVAAVLAVAEVALLFATQSSIAGHVVRDHRGANGAPQGGVTVNGARANVVPVPKPIKPKGSCEKGPCARPTVRDHR
jgi:hypothetical protein